jgi:class 3 adenylate cyclase
MTMSALGHPPLVGARPVGHPPWVMPYFMDRHDLTAATATDLAAAHVQDVAVQDLYDVRYVHYWFDSKRQHAFCLASGPSVEAVETVHRVTHGLVASRIIEVEPGDVTRFMGGIDPRPVGEAYEDTAFRAILFTDLVESTRFTERLGDAAVMSVVRRHDDIVRQALSRTGGTLVKRTGDGAMASFRSAASAVDAAVRIQTALRLAEAAGEMPLGVRIGIAAGEPVSDGLDLFGSAVNLAARLSSRSAPRSILVSDVVRELAAEDGYRFGKVRTLRLKGFDSPVRVSEVLWAEPVETAAAALQAVVSAPA